MHPYPSLTQLREHRGHIDKASEFGDELQARLTGTTPFGFFDAWKTLRVYNKTHKTKEKMKQSDDAASVIGGEAAVTGSDINAADDSAEKSQEQDLKALWLEALCELVDGLERLKKCVVCWLGRTGLTANQPLLVEETACFICIQHRLCPPMPRPIAMYADTSDRFWGLSAL